MPARPRIATLREFPRRCFPPYQWQIVQGLDQVVVLYEYPGAFRVIPMHGGPHQADLDPAWYGDSIGHWEGDTLVVDTIGFNDKTELPGGYRHTEALHVVERFRRVTFDHLDYQATIEDPSVFEKPWMVHRTLPLRTDLERVEEFICENNGLISRLVPEVNGDERSNRDYSRHNGTSTAAT